MIKNLLLGHWLGLVNEFAHASLLMTGSLIELFSSLFYSGCKLGEILLFEFNDEES